MASLRRSPAEAPGGDEERGEGTDEPDRLDDERLKVLIAAEVHGGADDADDGAGGQEAADEGVEGRCGAGREPARLGREGPRELAGLGIRPRRAAGKL